MTRPSPRGRPPGVAAARPSAPRPPSANLSPPPDGGAVPPPAGTEASGARLWTSVLDEYELEEHEMALLREAVRAVDQLDELAAIVRSEGIVVVNPGGGQRVHPAQVEARQLRIALARLLASLRLPAGEDGDVQAGARRPQRRVGVRGNYGIRRSAS